MRFSCFALFFTAPVPSAAAPIDIAFCFQSDGSAAMSDAPRLPLVTLACTLARYFCSDASLAAIAIGLTVTLLIESLYLFCVVADCMAATQFLFIWSAGLTTFGVARAIGKTPIRERRVRTDLHAEFYLLLTGPSR